MNYRRSFDLFAHKNYFFRITTFVDSVCGSKWMGVSADLVYVGNRLYMGDKNKYTSDFSTTGTYIRTHVIVPVTSQN